MVTISHEKIIENELAYHLPSPWHFSLTIPGYIHEEFQVSRSCKNKFYSSEFPG